jgi:hypothetical protein
MAERKRRIRSLPPVSSKSKTASAEPPELAKVQKARARIRRLVERTTSNAPRLAVSLVLALINQETGNHRAANEIIDEFGLEKRFGLQKFDFSNESKTPGAK